MAERAGIRLAGPPRNRPRRTHSPRGSSRCSRWWPDGRTNRQVGAELFISEKTVSVHLSRVMAKLGATSRTEAVSIAYTRGLLCPADAGVGAIGPLSPTA